MKKFLKIFLLILTLTFFQKDAFSQNRYYSDQCLDNKIDPQLIIKQFEEDVDTYIKLNIYQIILYDLKYIRYCYEKVKNEKKYFEIFEKFIDDGIISKKTYTQLEYKDFFTKKDWGTLFYNYVLSKSILNSSADGDVSNKFYPKTHKDFNYVIDLIDILNLDKRENFLDIVSIIYYSYLEDDYDINKDKVLEILNDNIYFAKENNLFTHYIISSRQKFQLLQNVNKEKCLNFFNDDFIQFYFNYKDNEYDKYLTENEIIETNDQIAKIYRLVFYCHPLSFEFAIEYSNVLEKLLFKDNSIKLNRIIKDDHLRLTFWQLDNYNKIDDKDKFEIYSKKYERLLNKYNATSIEKIEFEIFKINNDQKFSDLYLKEAKTFDLIKNLSDINFEEYKQSQPNIEENIFRFEVNRINLNLYKIYAEILIETGRKIEAVKILTDQIKFYESLRSENEYFIQISDNDLVNYKDTNQILPNLYHQVLLLFSFLKDADQFKNYTLKAFNLCDLLTLKNSNHDECYRINLAFLTGIRNFDAELFMSERVLEILNKVDFTRRNFLDSKNYKKYSDYAKARFENEYLHATNFAMLFIEPIESKKIIDFKYREKNTSYFYICEKDWQSIFLQNEDILKNNNAPELGLMAIKTACMLNNPNKENFEETSDNEKKYYEYTLNFLNKFKIQNENIKFKYLDRVGASDSFIFHIAAMYSYIGDFKSIERSKKKILEEEIFKSLQYQSAKIATNTKKNFLKNYTDTELDKLIIERKNLKIKYKNLVTKIFFNNNQEKNKFFQNKNLIENRLNEIDLFIEKNYKKFSNLNRINTYDYNDIQKLLKIDEVLIYLVNEEVQQAFIITKNETNLLSDLYLTKSRTEGVLSLTKKNINNEISEKLNENINALIFNEFFKKIIDKIKGTKKIIFIADKHYSNFPFEMMITNRPEVDIKALDQINKNIKPKYLIQDFEINYLPNIDIFINLRNINKTKLTKNSKFLGIGNPKLTRLDDDFSKKKQEKEIKFLRSGYMQNTNAIINKYQELPFTGKEIREMSKIFSNSTTLLRENANEVKVKNLDLKNFDIISFATHAEVYGNFSEYNEPFLVLSPPENSTIENDGLLTTSEISELNLNTELVILSACNTSSKENKYAEGYSGLVSSFFSAGTKSVISTYWPVEDKAGYILMTKTMEKTIKNNISISEALRQTKIEFINGEYGIEYKKPFYWAPYIYLGL